MFSSGFDNNIFIQRDSHPSYSTFSYMLVHNLRLNYLIECYELLRALFMFNRVQRSHVLNKLRFRRSPDSESSYRKGIKKYTNRIIGLVILYVLRFTPLHFNNISLLLEICSVHKHNQSYQPDVW